MTTPQFEMTLEELLATTQAEVQRLTMANLEHRTLAERYKRLYEEALATGQEAERALTRERNKDMIIDGAVAYPSSSEVSS